MPYVVVNLDMKYLSTFQKLYLWTWSTIEETAELCNIKTNDALNQKRCKKKILRFVDDNVILLGPVPAAQPSAEAALRGEADTR